MTAKTGRTWPGLAYEQEAWLAGYHVVAGLDEAGRGAWAGPVFAASVVLADNGPALSRLLGRVDDSKRLTPLARACLFDEVLACAAAVGVGSAANDEIDAIGILPATRLAMARALQAMPVSPDFLLLDFLTLPGIALPQRGIVHGDSLSLAIAAASILAKVSRDRWMAGQDQAFPGYGFRQHKGYGTAGHQAALRRLGPCPLHRQSFRPLVDLGLRPA